MDKNTNKNKTASIISIVIFVALMIWLCITIGSPLVKFVSEPEKFRAFVASRGIFGILAFIGMSALQVIVAIIPAGPFEVGGGYAFGSILGIIYYLIGSVLGSIIVFILVHRFGYKLVEAIFPREKINSMKYLKDSDKRDMLFFIFFLIPGAPKDFLTYFAGLTDIDTKTWLLICSVGRLPAIITTTVVGSAIGSQNYILAIVVFGISVMAAIVGIIIYKKISSREKRKSTT